MQSAGLRHRLHDVTNIQLRDFDGGAAQAVRPVDNDNNNTQTKPVFLGDGFEPPRFTVNLGLPPAQRYLHIVPHLQQQLSSADFTGLFDDVIRSVAPPAVARFLHVLARLGLRRLYSREETEELRGISKATGVSMHLLVAFNALLDLLLGCTSGGCRVESIGRDSRAPSSDSGGSTSMLHFRTLDWGMDTLRQIVVEINFVSSKGGPVVATSVTYFGYVGVLTGVRANLSMSLNFRPYHDRTTLRRRIGFRKHQMLVLLGLRQGISSVLRGYLLAPDDDGDHAQPSTSDKTAEPLPLDKGGLRMSRILSHVSHSPSTAAYLVFCTPQMVYSIEKDHRTAAIRSSQNFLATYNHDVSDESNPSGAEDAAKDLVAGPASGMEDLVRYSTDRKKHLDRLWREAINRRRRKLKRTTHAVAIDDLLHIVTDIEISNNETHYAVLMDPQRGKVIWRRVYPGDEED